MAADPYNWHRRLGRWRMGHTFIEDYPDAMWMLQKQAIIMNAEYDWATDDIEYTGKSEHFDIVERGLTIPFYSIKMRLTNGWPRKVLDIRLVRSETSQIEVELGDKAA